MIVSGVHFLADEKPELVAARALRVCLSDLAAGGATPLRLPARAVVDARLDRALGRRIRARARRRPAPLRHRAVRRRHDRHAGPDHDLDHRLRQGGARQGTGTRRRAGRGRALGERHDRRRRARPAGGPRRADERVRWRSAIACRSRARRWGRASSASPARQPTSPTACWPMSAISPMRRDLRHGSNAIRCRCRRRRGACWRRGLRSGATCWEAATTMNWRSPCRRESVRPCWRRRVQPV